jgi:hypothetical protein
MGTGDQVTDVLRSGRTRASDAPRRRSLRTSRFGQDISRTSPPVRRERLRDRILIDGDRRVDPDAEPRLLAGGVAHLYC